MICSLNMTSPHSTRITKWPHIVVISLNGVFWRFWVILATAKTVVIHFLIFWYFFVHGYIPAQPQAQVWKRWNSTLSPPLKSPKIPTLASLFSVPGWVGGFLLLVLGFGDPTKGMTRIWDHFVILAGCDHVIFKPQFMLRT